METLWQDLRYGARQLARSPGFTAVAVLTLALGIGANTAIFSVVNAVLLQPLPYPDSKRLVQVYLPSPGGNPRGPVSAIDFQDWREQNTVFESMGLVNTLSRGLTLSGGDEPELLPTAYVHPDFFATIGVQPVLGRAFRLDENDPGRNRVAVISHRLWQRRFGSDPALSGRVVTLEDQPFTILGVMPESYRFPDATIEAWAPESLIDAARAPRRRDVRYQRVFGRLRSGVTLEQARAEMNTIAAGLAAQYPETNRGRTTVTLVPLREALMGDRVQTAVLVLFSTAVLVLLIGCANVGNLLFERAVTRQREIAVRLALGAGRWRIVRQLLTEGVLLAFAGGLLGLAVGAWSLDALLALVRNFLPSQIDAVVDLRVLGFVLLASLLSALVFGAAPAFKLSQPELQRSLKEGARGSTPGGEGHRLRGLIVTGQTALALMLVVSAALMIRSLDRLVRVNPGFEPAGVLVVFMNASSTRYPERGNYMQFYRDVLARVQQIPGVQIAGATRNLPLVGAPESWPVAVEGQAPVPEGSEPSVMVHQISTDYFRAMRIPLLEGRAFTDEDNETAPSVAIVSKEMVRRFWPTESPVGRRLRYGPQTVTVVGVCGDVRQRTLDTEPQAAIYVPQPQDPRRGFTLVLQTTGDPRILAPTVRRGILEVDPAHPLLRVAPMEEVLGDSIARPRLMAMLLGLFSALALALAVIGVYGVTSYTTSLRTHEFGVRMALGAQPRNILGLVVGQGLRVALLGIGAGLAGAWATTRLLRSLLFEVSPTDLPTFAAVGLLLLGAALLACWIPARRAMRVDPMVALRYE